MRPFKIIYARIFQSLFVAALFFFALLFNNGCLFNSRTTEPTPPVISTKGLVPIPAKGQKFFLGSNSSIAASTEKPSVQIQFDYNFQMDTTEITQAAFNQIMGRNPVPTTSLFGQGDRYPVYDVSWFDAVLFCNARSKLAGFDTVYNYSRIEQLSGGTVFNLIGLTIHLEKNGFRLPTEAEWEFAAHAGGASDFIFGNLSDSSQAKTTAWYSDNSKNAAQPVASLKPNAYGLYDMAGNVMEWVNDWKALYPNSSLNDFAGARDPTIDFDTPVKGGAFKYGLLDLRISNRSATYTTIRSATSEYVGFRCVLGAIPSAKYSTVDGNVSETDPVQLEITRPQNLVAGRQAKLVFVNANQNVRHLVFVDYQKSPPRLKEFSDINNVFYPVISPDGKWVAFGTALEGSQSGSSIYIRSLSDSITPSHSITLGFIPRWWVDPVSKDTFLIYTNSAGDNSLPSWPSSQTLMQKISEGQPIGPPQKLVDGSFHDGRSQNGRWLATGFHYLKIRDAISNRIQNLFASPADGKTGTDTSQVCNVSMAPDSTGRTLFLDFGYEGKSTLTGSFYDIHQIAFMADPTGKIGHWYDAPRGEKGWEDLEWTNQVNYAVSASTDLNNGHHHLYLLNLKDSISTLLVSGMQLSTPGLWLGEAPESIPTDGLALDSLGHYAEPVTDVFQDVFSGRMNLFWKRHLNLELIFTGSSHVFSGINPNYITRYNSLSMAYPANGWLGQQTWVQNYALNHCPNLKVLVMEAFPGWLHFPGGDFTWLQQMSLSIGVKYDIAHDYWKSGLPYGFEKLVQQAPNSTNYLNDSTGYFFQATGNWGGAPIQPIESEWGLDDPEYKANMLSIEALAKIVSDKKIHLVLVNYPTNPAFKGNAYYGPYGPKLDVATEIIRRFKAMENISPYIHFYDANDFNNHDYNDSEAFNSGHLSSAGAEKLTKRIDSLVNTFTK